jgi:hypothetical protein
MHVMTLSCPVRSVRVIAVPVIEAAERRKANAAVKGAIEELCAEAE